jgi:hypothetical protein
VIGHLACFRRVDRERLLAEHVMSGVGCPLRPLGVEPVRERDVHRVDPIVFE